MPECRLPPVGQVIYTAARASQHGERGQSPAFARGEFSFRAARADEPRRSVEPVGTPSCPSRAARFGAPTKVFISRRRTRALPRNYPPAISPAWHAGGADRRSGVNSARSLRSTVVPATRPRSIQCSFGVLIGSLQAWHSRSAIKFQSSGRREQFLP